MKRQTLLLRLTIALAGLNSGFFVAAAWSGNGSEAGQTSGTMPAAAASQSLDRRSKSNEGPGRFGTSYASLKALLSENGGVVEARPAVERMTSGELRTLLSGAQFPMWGLPSSGEVQLRDGVLMAAAEELCRREGVEAVHWADASGRKEAAFALLRAFAEQDPLAANDHLKSYPFGYWDPNLLGDLITQMGEGAVKHSAAEVLKLEGNWKGSGLFRYAFEVPPDFDFREYFTKTSDDWRGGPGVLLTSWAASNPEASGAYIRDQLASPQHDQIVSPAAAFAGRAAMMGDQEAAQWFCNLLPEGREKDIRWALDDLARSNCTAGRANAIVQNLRSDESKIQFAASLIQNGSFRPEGAAVAVSAIQQLGSETVQADALIRCVKEYGPPGPTRDRMTSQMEDMMSQVNLPEAQRERVRAALEK